MREFKTENRLNKIINTVKARQHTLQVVLENIHDPHNVSAIFRTCDAVGVPEVSLLYHIEQFPKINRISSASANKWVQRERYTSVDECYGALRDKGFKIYASTLSPESVDLYSLDLTEKVALVLGNEHRGISDEAAKKADKVFLIPMMGMVQSLNVSVASAVILYEALRQRKGKNMYNVLQKDESEIERIIDEWCNK